MCSLQILFCSELTLRITLPYKKAFEPFWARAVYSKTYISKKSVRVWQKCCCLKLFTKSSKELGKMIPDRFSVRKIICWRQNHPASWSRCEKDSMSGGQTRVIRSRSIRQKSDRSENKRRSRLPEEEGECVLESGISPSGCVSSLSCHLDGRARYKAIDDIVLESTKHISAACRKNRDKNWICADVSDKRHLQARGMK